MSGDDLERLLIQLEALATRLERAPASGGTAVVQSPPAGGAPELGANVGAWLAERCLADRTATSETRALRRFLPVVRWRTATLPERARLRAGADRSGNHPPPVRQRPSRFSRADVASARQRSGCMIAPALIDLSLDGYLRERVYAAIGVAVPLVELVQDFRDWCRVRGDRRPVEAEQLRAELEARGLRIEENWDAGGRLSVFNIELALSFPCHPVVVAWARERLRRDDGAQSRCLFFWRDFQAWTAPHGGSPFSRRQFQAQLARLGVCETEEYYRPVVLGVVLVDATWAPTCAPHPDTALPLNLRDWSEACLRWPRKGAVATFESLHACYSSWAPGRSRPLLKEKLGRRLAKAGAGNGIERWRSVDGRRGLVGIWILRRPLVPSMCPEEMIQQWQRHRCRRDDTAVCEIAELHADFAGWAVEAGLPVLKVARFSRCLGALGFRYVRRGTERSHCRVGLALGVAPVARAVGEAAGARELSPPATISAVDGATP